MRVEFKELSPTSSKVLLEGTAVADYYSSTGVCCLTTPVSEAGQAAIINAIEGKGLPLRKSVPAPPDIPEDMEE